MTSAAPRVTAKARCHLSTLFFLFHAFLTSRTTDSSTNIRGCNCRLGPLFALRQARLESRDAELHPEGSGSAMTESARQACECVLTQTVGTDTIRIIV